MSERCGEIYRVRREMVIESLTSQFSDHLEVVPSIAGLYVTALARTASAEEIRSVVQRASQVGVEVQNLATFTVAPLGPVGIMLGYGAIPTANIKEGLFQLLGCFRST